MKRLPKLAEVADMAALMASDRASAMTGAAANVTCGETVDQVIYACLLANKCRASHHTNGEYAQGKPCDSEVPGRGISRLTDAKDRRA